jgi:S1-C subfamily serine protease
MAILEAPVDSTLESTLESAFDAPIEHNVLTGALSGEIAEIARAARESTVLVYRGGGNGAGVIWRSDGEIVTNSHVVGDGKQVDVVLADGSKYTGIVASRHPDRDLAVIKIAADGLPAAEVGDSSTVRPGQIAIAVGHPLGYRDAVTAGIVVASGQAATEGGPKMGDHIQADLTLLPGNSGGPLIDAWGRVIGINTMVAGALALAIPSQAVERFVAGGPTVRPLAYLGIEVFFAPELRRDGFTAGLVLTGVVEGSPADRAGLIIGDIVVAFADVSVVDQESLPAALLRLKPGDPVTVSVLRGDQLRSFTVVPTERAWED